ncbi:uncharacterized protein AKAW2_21371S [Aspergillus luchuensis]|uniref:Uncharacterized protein n=1 Tax=Aspergillus kawachii TaxID=1069201 RepID=A0A7R7WTX7_ASPKA|nr:uncharacterized protein AKAW2_21371S [Aspergillus luchuensis]BCR96431.1 hypothetical protein AKAW2_21371S [Aspergillus luchuensis]BCS08944.1 hypothetical protein ALUC_21314S [Aspergillus luchuensis]
MEEWDLETGNADLIYLPGGMDSWMTVDHNRVGEELLEACGISAPSDLGPDGFLPARVRVRLKKLSAGCMTSLSCPPFRCTCDICGHLTRPGGPLYLIASCQPGR